MFASFLSPDTIIQSGGLLVIALMIFAECGLLIGLLFPGDTLLLTAGLFSAQGKLPLGWLLITASLASIVGYQVGYRIGKQLGPKMFKREEGILFKTEYIEKTEHYFSRYGRATLILARFVANVRTFVSLMAGAGAMDKRAYLIYNIIGGVLWVGVVTMLGYGVGTAIPNIDHIFVPVLVVGLILIYGVVLYGTLRDKQRRHDFWIGLKSDMRYIFGRKN